MQSWLLGYFLTGPNFLALEGDLALEQVVVSGSPKTVRGELELAAPDMTCSKASKGTSWGSPLPPGLVFFSECLSWCARITFK